jgi:tyrosine-protein kinase Etk/Wzc
MTSKETGLVKINDDVDFVSLLFVLLENINLFITIFFASLFVSCIYYVSATKIYSSSSLLEIQKETIGFVPNSQLMQNNSNSLIAEIEIYKSSDTIVDTISNLSNQFKDNLPSVSKIQGGLSVSSSSSSLMSISLSYDDKDLTPIILDQLTKEFILDRKEFKKESSIAARKYIASELPKLKALLTKAEDNLNSFKLSTNSTDVIFDDKTRNLKLNELEDRVREINFKELELKEFYKTNHPIYVTLSQQKSLLLSQIEEIKKELPQIPTRQRQIENLKREVTIYADVIQKLSSEDINLSMMEASSTSNVRIINYASSPSLISPSKVIIFLWPFISIFIIFLIQALRYFLNNKISNPDALSDFIGKERVIGELPLLNNLKNKEKEKYTQVMSEELLHKTIFEITHSEKDFSSILFTSSRKNVGKTEVSEKIFNMLEQEGKKACLLDLDYRQGALSKKNSRPEREFKSFEEFFNYQEDYKTGECLFIPSLTVDSIPSFFKSNNFKENILKLKQEYDYVLCDTPPWSLFVDSKIIRENFEKIIYIVGSNISTFKDIETFEDEVNKKESTFFFFNKFNYFYNVLGLTYQYPYYSNDHYYDYENYRSIRKEVNITKFFVNLYRKFKNLFRL